MNEKEQLLQTVRQLQQRNDALQHEALEADEHRLREIRRELYLLLGSMQVAIGKLRAL